MIVRDIPDITQKNKQELGAISGASCTALSKAGLNKVQVGAPWGSQLVLHGAYCACD